jgi:acyl-coenzyme A synthetase/AMP-(fatty) acid ligase
VRIDDCELTLHDALEENCRLHPSKDFILSYDKAYTYGDVQKLSSGLAEFLVSMGMGKKDKACLLLPRGPELVISFLGMSLTGVMPAPVNYTLSREEIEKFISSADPSLMVVHEKFLDSFNPDAVLKGNAKVIVVGESSSGHIPWDKACYPSENRVRAEVSFHDIAYLNYTTGSSGDPKGAIATHFNIYWNTRASVEAMEIDGDDVHLCMFASFAHPHELFARALYTGGALALLEEINPKTILRTINDKKVTCMMGLAPMYDMLASHCGGMNFEHLRVAESGGMFTRPEIIRNFKRHFGIPVLSVWGSTETTGIAIANTPSQFRDDGSTGMVCPHYEARILDETGNDVKEGEIGEIAFRGNGVVSGYMDTDAFSSLDGWYLSGDLGRRDGEGYYYFVERQSGMLKVAGLKVYPLQVEIILMSHERIKEAAVIGVEDRLRGVVPKAYVVPKEGFNPDPEDIKRFCRGKMADYMVPRKIQVIEELPKIGSGKINKKALRG